MKRIIGERVTSTGSVTGEAATVTKEVVAEPVEANVKV